MKHYSLATVLLALLVCRVAADTYLHNPRGSNNRLNERSANRNNANRLFDSQNNNRGGYNVGEANPSGTNSDGQIKYVEGSLLPIEWTNQHGCGVNQGKLSCQMVIQYRCDCAECGKPMRDGTSTATPDPDNDNTNTGLHEEQAWYQRCRSQDRNKGLFTADQNLRGNDARYTRQNPNGNRRGLECPEERDYYPYWHPTPWVDVAVLTDNARDFCPYYQRESFNVKGKGRCQTNPKYNNEPECTANSGRDDAGWMETRPFKAHRPSLKTVDCQETPWTRDNHLGNTDKGAQPAAYMWKIPSVLEACEKNTGFCRCVLRTRYNISTMDYSWDTNSTWNGNRNIRDGQPSPVTQNPTLNPGTESGLRLAMNTAQFGRTFQDRTHIFEIHPRPQGVPANANVHNINVRGKRGNIVQTYPAVEYDFVPNRAVIKQGDFVHFQWTGSNTHNNGNPAGDGQAGDDGQGTGGTDRSNVVEIDGLNENYPTVFSDTSEGLFPNDDEIASRVFPASTNYDTKRKLVQTFASAGKVPAQGNTVNKLLNDASPTFNGPLMKMTKKGTFHYMCTRNNNFSNRSQKGSIVVE